MDSSLMDAGIPLLVAVTGHRDIDPGDRERLEREVGTIIGDLKARMTDTDIVLLSALAEGADRIAARAALDAGAGLGVVLPCAEDRYLTSFQDPASESEFRDLKSRALFCRTLEGSGSPEEDYRNLGRHLADNSTVLIALWDGTDNRKPGGTAWVVDYKENGGTGNRFAHRDGDALYHIRTPRIPEPDRCREPGAKTARPSSRYPGQSHRLFRRNGSGLQETPSPHGHGHDLPGLAGGHLA